MAYFSVIIPTRNRPVSFQRALTSVLDQTWPDVEIIVVDDGSRPEHEHAYQAALNAADRRSVRSFDLIRRECGHGGAYVRNFGADQASAPYLCFLDDDDCWIDGEHLDRAARVIADASGPVDLYMTNQIAVRDGQQEPGPVWLEDLPPILRRTGNRPDRRGAYTVTAEDLVRSQGFCHLNTLIVRRGLFEEVSGLEETIRWEEDRDFYLRLIDRAGLMKYLPVTTAQHNVPSERESMTTVLSEMERSVSQLTVFDRAWCLSQHAAIRAYARRHKAYTLKRIVESLAEAGHWEDAAFYAKDAFRTGPTVKWAGYMGWLVLCALAIGRAPAKQGHARPGNRPCPGGAPDDERR